jgi:hypothetical protein
MHLNEINCKHPPPPPPPPREKKKDLISVNFHFTILQHGSEECLLNTIEACTITVYPDVVSPAPNVYTKKKKKINF